MSDKKLAVIFPGIGYHTDKPLLYYSKKIARQHGYDIVELSFHDIDKDALLAGGRPDALTQPVFVAKYKYTKLQDQNGQCCMSKKDKVASLTPE